MLVLLLAAGGCSQDADRMARVCQKTAAKFDSVTGGMRSKLNNGWGAVRGSVSEASLDSRVALRLRWDVDLTGAEIQVRPAGAGIVELRGTVADLAQRTRAVHLARTTTGVENVLDALTVETDADKAP
jgi:osmotically-inducible protein OsmY